MFFGAIPVRVSQRMPNASGWWIVASLYKNFLFLPALDWPKPFGVRARMLCYLLKLPLRQNHWGVAPVIGEAQFFSFFLAEPVGFLVRGETKTRVSLLHSCFAQFTTCILKSSSEKNKGLLADFSHIPVNPSFQSKSGISALTA